MYFLLLPDLYLFLFNLNSQLIALSILVWVYIFSLLKTTKHLYLFFPFLCLIPTYIYYIYLYRVPLTEQILSVVLETNFQETWSFLGSHVYLYMCGSALWLMFSVWICYQNYHTPRIWSHRSRYWMFVVGTLYFAGSYALNTKIVDEPEQSAIKNDINFMVEGHNYFLQEIKQTYPMGLFVTVYDLFQEQDKINQAFEKNKNFKFNAIQHAVLAKKQIYVLVIGETSRRENWQLNGYVRATNPQLSQQHQLVNFSNMLSLVSATRSSIPMILTRKSENQVYHYSFPEKSIISAFKEAGFKTYWLSTQQKFGTFDTSTSVYAKEADQMIFVNKTNYTQAGEFDDVMVPYLQEIVAKVEPKQFIVIHTLGSHYNYQHRYPKIFDQFKPSLNDLKHYSLQDKSNKQQLVNSYDNSILFTDHVLNQFIHTLEQQKETSSFLLYSSDHGEDLFDQSCHQSGHGLVTKRNFEVAGFAWYSAKFASQFSDKVAQLQQNKNRKINHTAIFPTLLDAANITLPDDSLKRSVLKPFIDYPRIVLSSYDYDQTASVGVCQEIK